MACTPHSRGFRRFRGFRDSGFRKRGRRNGVASGYFLFFRFLPFSSVFSVSIFPFFAFFFGFLFFSFFFRFLPFFRFIFWKKKRGDTFHGKGGLVELKGGSRHDQSRHNRRNRQNRHGRLLARAVCSRTSQRRARCSLSRTVKTAKTRAKLKHLKR